VLSAYRTAVPYALGFGFWGRGRPELAAEVLPQMPA
jgi:hypothetical protein